MQFPHCIKKTVTFFLFLLLTLPGVLVPAETQSEPEALSPEKIAYIQNNILKPRIGYLLHIFSKIDFTIEHLIQIASNNQLRSINKHEAVEYLKNVRSFIQQISNEANLSIEPSTLAFLHVMAKSLIKHIDIIIKSGLKNFPEFDTELTRSGQAQEINIEEIDKELKQLEGSLTKLNSSAQTVGLSLFNRAFRRVDKFQSDYNITSKAFKLGVAGLIICGFFGAAYPYLKDTFLVPADLTDAQGNVIKDEAGNAIKHMVPNTDASPFKHYFGKFLATIGPRPEQGTHGTKFDWINGKLFGLAEGILRDNNLFDPRIVAPITAQAIIEIFKSDWKQLKLSTAQRWAHIKSRLRGEPPVNFSPLGEKEPKVRFEDVIGNYNNKMVLLRLVEFIKNPEQYVRAGIKPPKGILLCGKSRSGKSFIAEGLAGEMKSALLELGITEFKFFSITAGEILQAIQSEGHRGFNITTFIEMAQQHAPCVLFVDEIDMLSLQRTTNPKMLSELLTAMSGCMNNNNKKPVFIIAATNKPENLDTALLQPGRFETQLWFDYPTAEERLEFLVHYLKKRGIISIDDSTLQQLARETEGCSFESLNSIMSTALLKAKAVSQPLKATDLEEAFDEESRKIIFDDMTLNEQEKKLVACHQAGKTVAALLLDKINEIVKVTIRLVQNSIEEEPVWYMYHSSKQNDKKHAEYGKVFTARRSEALGFNTQESLLATCKINLAGKIAEELLLGSTDSSYRNDERLTAFAIAKHIIFKGIKPSELSKGKRQKLQGDVENLLDVTEKAVRELLEKNKDFLVALADQLQERLTLTREEILELYAVFNNENNDTSNR